ncbi:hypothetical protein GCM10022222_67670 [Amycolatopsis ultiminotia]|uniref:Uncharacterized protein n=1 Tax=Amycolatopsis ultiminotia TaxID=543629 RepID=A0ABP6XXL0_9PSEU
MTEGSTADGKLVALYGKNNAVRSTVGVGMVRSVRSARAHVVARTAWGEVVTQKGVPA